MHVCPEAQPPPHVVSQTHWPHVVDEAFASHLEPWAHAEPPQVWSQMHAWVPALHTKPDGQWPHCGGSQKPHVAEVVSVLQVSLTAQPPPHVVSHAHWPHVDDDVLVLQVLPAGQPPPHVVSHRHMPHVVEVQARVLAFQAQPEMVQLDCDRP